MNTKVTNSQQRIRELMDYYKLSQTELCKRTGLLKSALSNYLNGDREPRQDQISLIADPFNINPAWLMGYDVPMFMSSSDDKASNIREFYKNTDSELREKAENDPQLRELISLFLNGSETDREYYLKILRGLQQNP